MDSHALLHAELIAFLRQHCPACDQRHLTLLGWMVTGLLLSQTVCFGHWQQVLLLHQCLAASWQRRCRRWLSNPRIEVDALYGPLLLWAIQQWQKQGHSLHLALDTTVLWNRFCVVMISVVCHGRAIPLLWQTLEHPSASVSAPVVIGLLQRADRLLTGFGAITVLADRGFPSAELLSWFKTQPRWHDVMRLRSDTWIHGTAAPMGCQVRRLRLPRGHCRGFRAVQLWGDGNQRANLLLARPIGIKAAEPWYLVSNLNPTLDLVWAYGQRFCCEQLFRDQKSGIFQLERSGLRDPERIDRLLLVVAIAVLLSSLQGYAVSLSGQRRRVDPHWKRGLSFARIGLHWLQRSASTASRALLAWLPIPLQTLEPCIPSRRVSRRQKRPWFSRVELPLLPRPTAPTAVPRRSRMRCVRQSGLIDVAHAHALGDGLAEALVGGGGVWGHGALDGPSGRRPCWDPFWCDRGMAAAIPTLVAGVPPQTRCPDRGSIPPTTARLVPLEGAMQEILFVVEEAEDGSYRASAAGAAIHTEADTLEELHQEIRDAVVCHFDPGEAPPLIRLHHVRQELLAL